MNEERSKRKEEMLWEKAKELWKDWKVTICIIWFFCLATIGFIIFAIINWNTGFWRGGGFSGEVDAAMINSLVAIFVTVPITLLTGAGTILVTAYFNLQTQRIAIQAQRSALRDKILEKRITLYPQIGYKMKDISKTIRSFREDLSGNAQKAELEEKIESITDFVDRNRVYISNVFYRTFTKIMVLSRVLLQENLSEQEIDTFYSKFKELYDEFYKILREELNLETIDQDWKFLQQYRIDDDFPYDNEPNKNR